MSEFLGYQDVYLKEFDGRVVEINPTDNSLALDRSAFFPGGGGQPCDLGRLIVNGRTLNVIKMSKHGETLWHWVDGHLPNVGENVHGVLDWERRYRLMRTHTALHVLCGVVWRDYGASVTGGNMEPLKGRMDFEFETMHGDLVQVIEKSVNAEIAAAHPVTSRTLPRAEAFKIPDLIRTKINLLPEAIQQVRIVEIVGLDLQADGGTHVANTKEVGRIRVVDYKSKGRINKRIEIEITD